MIEANPLSKMVLVCLLLPLATGCAQLQGLIGGGADEAVQLSDDMLVKGDLPGAADAFTNAAKNHPESVDAAIGASFSALLMGDLDQADAHLEAAEAHAGEQVGEIKLRRALIALENEDLEAVKSYGLASGLPAGKLLAAEVSLTDGEREEAAGYLAEAASESGAVGETAQAYLDLIEDSEPLVSGLSEVQALWALGVRKVAVRSVEELVKNLPEDRGDRDELLLIWAGRAAAVGQTDIAQSLLDTLIFAPEGQAWRKVATQAIIACADGNGSQCLKLFKSIEGKAPEAGLADAQATAAYLIAKADPEVAQELAGPYISPASARALVEAGDIDAARESAPSGSVYAQYLNSGG